jgi:hypothetical protein
MPIEDGGLFTPTRNRWRLGAQAKTACLSACGKEEKKSPH